MVVDTSSQIIRHFMLGICIIISFFAANYWYIIGNSISNTIFIISIWYGINLAVKQAPVQQCKYMHVHRSKLYATISNIGNVYKMFRIRYWQDWISFNFMTCTKGNGQWKRRNVCSKVNCCIIQCRRTQDVGTSSNFLYGSAIHYTCTHHNYI